MRLVDQRDYVDIYIDDENRWLYANWKGYQSDGSIIEGANLMHEILKGSGLTKVLVDNREVIGIWISMAEWIAQDWIPRLHAAGMKKFALIYSPARFSRVSANAVRSLHDRSLCDVFGFSVESEAREWLAAD